MSSFKSGDPLNDLFADMMKWLLQETDKICDKYGLDREEVQRLSEGKSFDEFTDALDKLVAEKKAEKDRNAN
jgi:hypothetical protein